MEVRHVVQRILVLVGLCLGLGVPASAWAQLVPGQHRVMPYFGATFATNMLLHATAIHPTPRPSDPENPVVTDIALDPGAVTGLRYTYNLTRRLAVEAEYSLGLSIFAIEMLELMEDADPEALPQIETTTMDARITRLFVNVSYHFGPWEIVHPFVTVGLGQQILDLRQKGEVDPDPIMDRTVMAGWGLHFRVNDRLGIRAELRDYMYKFSFDNQFVGDRSDEIVFRRDIGLTTAVASPRFQNDLLLTLGFTLRAR